jgi:hypothetical protein
MMMAWDDRSNTMPKKMMVAYKDATATTAGITAWMPANTAMRKLCLNRTGWVIGHPFQSRAAFAVLARGGVSTKSTSIIG